MEIFTDNNAKFEKEFKNQNLMIENYDKAISLKCSIQRLRELRKNMEARYDPELTEIKKTARVVEEDLRWLEC